MPRYRSSSRSPRRRSRSRSYDRYRNGGGGGRDRDRSYDRDGGGQEDDMCRLHVADLTESVSQHELERVFSKYGDLKEVWTAKNPPCFAFIVYKNSNDAAVALREMDGRYIYLNIYSHSFEIRSFILL